MEVFEELMYFGSVCYVLGCFFFYCNTKNKVSAVDAAKRLIFKM